MSRSFEWRPVDWEGRLDAALSTGDLTVASLRERQQAIRGLCEEVDRYIIDEYCPHLPVHVMQKTTYEHLKLLVDEGSMAVAEWNARTGQDVPNFDPFHPVITAEKGRIILDHDALFRVEPADMYAWHYAVLRAVVEGI